MMLEMTTDEIDAFLSRQLVGRVGCHTDGLTYVVPVIYVWDEGLIHVYSVEGQKIRMMRDNPDVCFEVDEYGTGGGWMSVIIQGVYEELPGELAARTLRLLAARFADRSATGESQRPRAGERAPVAFQIRPNAITGRKVEATNLSVG